MSARVALGRKFHAEGAAPVATIAKVSTDLDKSTPIVSSMARSMHVAQVRVSNTSSTSVALIVSVNEGSTSATSGAMRNPVPVK